MIKKWKKSTKFTNQKIGKEKEILVQKYVYVCTLNKVKYGKTCCETNDVLLQDPFDCLCGKPQ